MRKPKEGYGIENKSKGVSVRYVNGLVWIDPQHGLTIAQANAMARCILLLTGGDFKKPKRKP